MKTWNELGKDIGLNARVEGSIHPHAPEERAHLYRSHDDGGTEYEFLNLIHAFVLALKPEAVLETGTYGGLGTLAISHALALNGTGKLWTVDIEMCDPARKLIEQSNLSQRVEFVTMDAYEFIKTVDRKYDMAFVDSGGARLQEANLLVSLNRLSPHAVVLLHDASPYRVGMERSWHTIFTEECSLKGFTIPFSRGIRIMYQ